IENSVNVQDVYSIKQFHVFNAQKQCLLGEYEATLESIAESKKFIVGKGLYGIEAPQLFYESLALIKLAQQSNDEEKIKEYREAFDANHIILQGWMADCPENFSNKYYLLEAEKAVLDGREYEAIQHYTRAIDESSTNNFLVEQALC